MVITPFGVIYLKLSDFKRYITIDERQKTPMSQQLTESLTRMIFNRQLFLDQELPHPLLLGDSLDIDPVMVEKAYQNLIDEGLAHFDQQYYVKHHNFVYDFFGQRLPIEKALKLQGYEPRVKFYPSVFKTEGDLKMEGIKFPYQDIHMKRADYYANHYLFAVTFNYIPAEVIPDFDAYMDTNGSLATALKEKTSLLRPKALYEAVIYPKEVAKSFKVPYGRAGLKISYDYLDDQDRLIHAYRGYFTSWIDVQFHHDLTSLSSIQPLQKKEPSQA